MWNWTMRFGSSASYNLLWNLYLRAGTNAMEPNAFAVPQPDFEDFPWIWGIQNTIIMRLTRSIFYLYSIFFALRPTSSAPQSFPSSGNGLWYTQPGDVWAREWLPVGNGYLGGMSISTIMCSSHNMFLIQLWYLGTQRKNLYS